ncbi:alpha/beta fold hydrolase [Pseudonocardia humida]|uniref:Alpha/beta hydrolase n=1 Tax=Pseudonocardia humida TaxID=2800819 RepID=A0ABT0ZY32_9PSEU|nr:alpha/beta hydrolase [Pseudonocardia humida]MCO1655626.1 alpha/beta hydrolase [Pseudonocardia humida]
MDVATKYRVTVRGPEDGPVLLLAHGFGCDQHMWRLVEPILSRTCRVVLFDFPGAGGAQAFGWSEERYSRLDGYAEDVAAICRELDLRDVVVVGHSVSAMIGVLAAELEPDRVAGLVLVTPSPRYIDDGDYRGGFSRADIDELLESLDSNYLGWSAAMAPVIMGNPDRPELGRELTNSFCRMDPRIAQVFARATFLSDSRADLPGVAVPALILQCAQDAIAPPEVGAYVHEHIAGSRLVTLDATGHCPQLSAPDQTAAAILSFVGAQR